MKSSIIGDLIFLFIMPRIEVEFGIFMCKDDCCGTARTAMDR